MHSQAHFRSDALRRKSPAFYEAFRKAKQRGRIEVPLFDVPNRRGSFALPPPASKMG